MPSVAGDLVIARTTPALKKYCGDWNDLRALEMNTKNFHPDRARLAAVMREARVTPSLPLGFQANVWRRIESAEARTVAAGDSNWLDTLVGWLVRPRLALAVATVLVLVGVGLGWSRGEHLAQRDAQARYLAAVAPNALR